MTGVHAAVLGVLLSLPAAAPAVGADPTAVYRVKDGDAERELRLWPARQGSLRFELAASVTGEARPVRLAGMVEPQPPGDSECDSYPDEAIGECWEVREYIGAAGTCWVSIRMEIEDARRLSVQVADCAEAPRFHSRAIYGKVE